MVWSWTMVRFLFWVADFAFVFDISVELFVLINKVVYNSGSAIILYNLVLSFDDLPVAFFMSRVDVWSAIRIVVVDIITKNVWLRVMVRIFVVWSMIWSWSWGVVWSWSWGISWFRSMVWGWSWSISRFRGMIWSWSRGVIRSWCMVWCWLIWQLVSYYSSSNH